MSVFAQFQDKAWPHRFSGQLQVEVIAGGTPSDPHIAEGFIRTKMGVDNEQQIQEMVAEIMVERNVPADQAVKLADELRHLNGFKRDSERGLFIEGRQLKAALKEACSIAVASGKLDARGWGKTNKGLLSFAAEHIQVVERRLYLGVTEPTGVIQSFPKNKRTNQTGLQYTEFVEGVTIDFTVKTDWPFTEEQWAMIWLTGQDQGIGASRSQGFGRYEVTRWDKVEGGPSKGTRTSRPSTPRPVNASLPAALAMR